MPSGSALRRAVNRIAGYPAQNSSTSKPGSSCRLPALSSNPCSDLMRMDSVELELQKVEDHIEFLDRFDLFDSL